MHLNPEDETLYTTQYEEAFMKYGENEYWAKHRQVPVINQGSVPTNNLFPSATTEGCGQSSFDSDDFSSDDDEYVMPHNAAVMAHGRSDSAAR